ncbi:MAG TPA: pseudouridine synthase, partial [Albitalea sp.]|nr:pseudouridine synthase [Albitalea sp.]
MATLKLKKTPAAQAPRESRPPVRGAGSAPRKRPTLAEAQAQRAERETRYQEQLRQRFGDKPPAAFKRRDEVAEAPRRRPAPARPAPARPLPPQTARGPNKAFDAPPRQRAARPERDDAPEHAEQPGSLRLSKRMSELGIASRREADEWIAKGWVRVDGQVVSELGSRVLPDQHITVDAKAKFVQAQKVTVLLNKPVGYVSGQAEDGYEPAVVLVTPQNQWREDRSGTRFLRDHLRGLAPAGRLDIDSVGLLVLTQDGRIAKQLIGEDSDIEKEYLVRVQVVEGESLSDQQLALLNHGLELDGEALRPAKVEWVNADQLRFVLKQGKKRQIRRMCEAVGVKVLGLKRVRIGGVMLGDLPPGHWRYLRM